jgi:hypothetical protein
LYNSEGREPYKFDLSALRQQSGMPDDQFHIIVMMVRVHLDTMLKELDRGAAAITH